MSMLYRWLVCRTSARVRREPVHTRLHVVPLESRHCPVLIHQATPTITNEYSGHTLSVLETVRYNESGFVGRMKWEYQVTNNDHGTDYTLDRSSSLTLAPLRISEEFPWTDIQDIYTEVGELVIDEFGSFEWVDWHNMMIVPNMTKTMSFTTSYRPLKFQDTFWTDDEDNQAHGTLVVPGINEEENLYLANDQSVPSESRLDGPKVSGGGLDYQLPVTTLEYIDGTVGHAAGCGSRSYAIAPIDNADATQVDGWWTFESASSDLQNEYTTIGGTMDLVFDPVIPTLKADITR